MPSDLLQILGCSERARWEGQAGPGVPSGIIIRSGGRRHGRQSAVLLPVPDPERSVTGIWRRISPRSEVRAAVGLGCCR